MDFWVILGDIHIIPHQTLDTAVELASSAGGTERY